MVRCSRVRCFLREVARSPFGEKLSFFLPFFVITIDIIILEHAIRIQEAYIIACTLFLFFLSLFEIIIVSRELHVNYQKSNFEKKLTIKLDNFIKRKKQYNIKKIVEDRGNFWKQEKNGS
ncbi:MAG: hypothetical protein QHH15_06020 [Candidatus Thermoplasmatota archaeon]|nr:hypothetical protein [Candidatus Thermoplasmatota archaeon]